MGPEARAGMTSEATDLLRRRTAQHGGSTPT